MSVDLFCLLYLDISDIEIKIKLKDENQIKNAKFLRLIVPQFNKNLLASAKGPSGSDYVASS